MLLFSIKRLIFLAETPVPKDKLSIDNSEGEFTIKLFKVCFLKDEINIKEEIRKYNKILLFCLCLSIISSIFEVFIDPFMIKIYQMKNIIYIIQL